MSNQDAVPQSPERDADEQACVLAACGWCKDNSDARRFSDGTGWFHYEHGCVHSCGSSGIHELRYRRVLENAKP